MLIKSYGLFWKAADVYWGKPNNAGTLLGIEVGNKQSDPVNFRRQIGVYVLYDDNFKIVYIGQVGARDRQRLFSRLKDHTRGNLSERWSKFSWFGLLGVRADGFLSSDAPMKSKSSKQEIVDHIEAILISATEPPHNRQGGRFGSQVRQFRQYRDHELLGPKADEILRDLHKLRLSN